MSQHKRSGSASDETEPKRPRQDESSETGSDKGEENKPKTKNPGKKEYQELGRLLYILQQLSNKADLSAEDNKRVSTVLSALLKVLKEEAGEDKEDKHDDDDEEEEEEEVEMVEVPNCIKLLQIHVKDKCIKSQSINDEFNIVNFVEGLEDGSACISDQDNVFVFLAPQATELWYRWNNGERQWEWTPDQVNWMLCSRTTVSGGKWKNETPAPENVEIIGYLNSVRPVPSDEMYLQVFDVLEILRQLKTKCGAGEGCQLVNEIVTEVNKAKKGTWIDEEFTL